MNFVTIKQFLDDRREEFHLEVLTGEIGLERHIVTADIYRPGLALTGYMGYFLWERVQIIGITETGYLETLSTEARLETLRRIMSHQIPCIIVTKKLQVHRELVETAKEQGVTVISTDYDTTDFIHRFSSYIDNKLAPTATVHAALVDVYGVGLLFTGESGIGKSECALDLVERGHRLVADDVVFIKRRGLTGLVGYGNQTLQHHMEIRGVGIIDLATLFGIRAVRMRKG